MNEWSWLGAVAVCAGHQHACVHKSGCRFERFLTASEAGEGLTDIPFLGNRCQDGDADEHAKMANPPDILKVRTDDFDIGC